VIYVGLCGECLQWSGFRYPWCN